MAFPITGYLVFVYKPEVGPHAPQFQSMDEAEKFANDLRATTTLTVSEPIPVIASEEVKVPTCIQD